MGLSDGSTYTGTFNGGDEIDTLDVQGGGPFSGTFNGDMGEDEMYIAGTVSTAGVLNGGLEADLLVVLDGGSFLGTINGDEGDDIFVLQEGGNYGGTTNGGEGEDSLILEDQGTATGSFTGFFNGGVDDDILLSLEGSEFITIDGATTLGSDINVGDDLDLIFIFENGEVSGNVDGGAGIDPVFAALGTLTTDDERTAALKELAPSDSGADTQLQSIQALSILHLISPRIAGGTAKSRGFSAHADRTVGRGDVPLEAFAYVSGAKRKQGRQATLSGYDVSEVNATFGIDYATQNDVTIGGYLDYHSASYEEENGVKGTVSSQQVGAYFANDFGRASLYAAGFVGKSKFDETRKIEFRSEALKGESQGFFYGGRFGWWRFPY